MLSVFVRALERWQVVVTSRDVFTVQRLADEIFGGYGDTSDTGRIATAERMLFDAVASAFARERCFFLPGLELPGRLVKSAVVV